MSHDTPHLGSLYLSYAFATNSFSFTQVSRGHCFQLDLGFHVGFSAEQLSEVGQGYLTSLCLSRYFCVIDGVLVSYC